MAWKWIDITQDELTEGKYEHPDSGNLRAWVHFIDNGNKNSGQIDPNDSYTKKYCEKHKLGDFATSDKDEEDSKKDRKDQKEKKGCCCSCCSCDCDCLGPCSICNCIWSMFKGLLCSCCPF